MIVLFDFVEISLAGLASPLGQIGKFERSNISLYNQRDIYI